MSKTKSWEEINMVVVSEGLKPYLITLSPSKESCNLADLTSTRTLVFRNINCSFIVSWFHKELQSFLQLSFFLILNINLKVKCMETNMCSYSKYIFLYKWEYSMDLDPFCLLLRNMRLSHFAFRSDKRKIYDWSHMGQ